MPLYMTSFEAGNLDYYEAEGWEFPLVSGSNLTTIVNEIEPDEMVRLLAGHYAGSTSGSTGGLTTLTQAASPSSSSPGMGPLRLPSRS